MTLLNSSESKFAERGSVAVEIVLLTPLMVVFLLFIAHVGRSGEGISELRHAADQGARAASLAAQARMSTVAREAVLRDLATSGSSCERPSVAVVVQRSSASESVRVDVHCWVSNIGLSLVGARPVLLTASSTEVIDRYRGES